MYRITQVLSVGPFASLERAEPLRAAGVTRLLNVCDAASVLEAPAGGFKEVAWVPLDDFVRWPTHRLTEALDTLHRLAAEPDAHVYVHCMAGQHRSPTVLWLYLIAMGIPPDDARDWIEERSPIANPGHRRMVDHEHILLAQKHGLANFFPHPRPEIIVPFELPAERPE